MRSVARYPEVRDDGSMWVPIAPPPAPSYQQLSPGHSGVIGKPAVLSYSTEWLMGLRVLTDPYEERTNIPRCVVQLCEEGAWYDFQRHGVEPQSHECIVASVRLVFMVVDAGAR